MINNTGNNDNINTNLNLNDRDKLEISDINSSYPLDVIKDKSDLKTKFYKLLPHKGEDKKNLILKIICYILVAAILFLAIYLINYFYESYENNNMLSSIRDSYNEKRYNYEYNTNGTFSKFDTLLAQNPDTVGWLTVNNTKIDNPIYQSGDNEFYISHNCLQESAKYGALFLDCTNSIIPYSKNQNMIIYGHYMKDGSMFGTITNYKDINFYKENPTISFDTLYEKGTYKIFAILIGDSGTDNSFGFEYKYWNTSFASQEEFLQWVELSRIRSLINTTVDVQAYDEVLTLSTCANSYYKNARFVIMARRIRTGESEEVDTFGATINPNPLYPVSYYDKNNKELPDSISVSSVVFLNDGSGIQNNNRVNLAPPAVETNSNEQPPSADIPVSSVTESQISESPSDSESSVSDSSVSSENTQWEENVSSATESTVP